jgi:hypothetical protein
MKLATAPSIQRHRSPDDPNGVANVSRLQIVDQRLGVLLIEDRARIAGKRHGDAPFAVGAKLRVQAERGILSQPHPVEILNDEGVGASPKLQL